MKFTEAQPHVCKLTSTIIGFIIAICTVGAVVFSPAILRALGA